MRPLNLSQHWRHRAEHLPPQAVVIRVDRDQCRRLGIGPVDIDRLLAAIQDQALQTRLGVFDGCASLVEDTRIYLFSSDARALAAALSPVIEAHCARHCTTLHICEKPLRGAWQDVKR